MAALLYGNVFYKDIYAGKLREEPGSRSSFEYDSSYIESGNPQIAYTLPINSSPIISENGLHPFFDNLVAEGWLEAAQARALGIDRSNRFALLLGFGHDLAGAVSVIDPEPRQRLELDFKDNAMEVAMRGDGSLSGVQPKLLIVKDGNGYRPPRNDELSTHIAKFAPQYEHLVDLEFLTTLAVGALLPKDDIVEMEVVENIGEVHKRALVIKRFDRTISGKRIHFEEFAQLLGRNSKDKFDGSYEDMAQFIFRESGGNQSEAERLFRRVLACFVVGNTDAHFKNFAMFHTRDGLRLTPSYDQVACGIDDNFDQHNMLALGVNGTKNFKLGNLLPKNILLLGSNFQLRAQVVVKAVEDIGKRISNAQEAIKKSHFGNRIIKNSLIEGIEKRWNGTFASIGQLLLKRQGKGVKS